jgi:hypothetical protein
MAQSTYEGTPPSSSFNNINSSVRRGESPMPDGGMGESPAPGSGQLLQHTPTQGNQAVDHNLNELGSLPLYMTAANKHGSDGSNLSSICRSGCENVESHGS